MKLQVQVLAYKLLQQSKNKTINTQYSTGFRLIPCFAGKQQNWGSQAIQVNNLKVLYAPVRKEQMLRR